MRRILALLLAAVLAAGCTLPLGRDTSGPGDAAKELVSGAKYPKLLVEIDHPRGAAPSAAGVEHLKRTLQQVTGKSSVEVTLSASIPHEPSKRYTFQEIAALEDEHRDRRTGGDTAVLYIMYVSGGSEDDSDRTRVLGATYRGTSIVMFKSNLQASAGSGPLSGKPSIDIIESAVLVHEFGHAAGLVNLGTDMVRPHEDPEHKGHSSNRESVMYWAVETSAGLDLLCSLGVTGCQVPLEFDADDKADLQRLRES